MPPERILNLAIVLRTLVITSPVLASIIPVVVASSFFQGRVRVGDWTGHGHLGSQGKKGSEDEDGGLHDELMEGIV